MKADLCVQYVDDIGVAAHTASELIENLHCVLKLFKDQVLKYPSKCVSLVKIRSKF